jgi:hypothetical protein
VSHLLGARRLGATRPEIRGALRAGLRGGGDAVSVRRKAAARAWRQAFGA